MAVALSAGVEMLNVVVGKNRRKKRSSPSI
jgi:hypothetical protein